MFFGNIVMSDYLSTKIGKLFRNLCFCLTSSQEIRKIGFLCIGQEMYHTVNLAPHQFPT